MNMNALADRIARDGPFTVKELQQLLAAMPIDVDARNRACSCATAFKGQHQDEPSCTVTICDVQARLAIQQLIVAMLALSYKNERPI
jgi:hypothetical protein